LVVALAEAPTGAGSSGRACGSSGSATTGA